MPKYDGLTVRWSKREKDILYSFPRKQDGAMANMMFSMKRCHPDHTKPFGVEWDPSFIEELEARGYDIKTLRFSCKLKTPPARPAATD